MPVAPLTPSAQREVRNFGVVMCLALGALAAYAFARHRPLALVAALAAAAGVLLVASFAAPARVRPLERGWMSLGHLLGRVTTPVLLFAVFALVIVPLRALMFVLRQDPLALRRDPAARTYWLERRRRDFSREDFERLS